MTSYPVIILGNGPSVKRFEPLRLATPTIGMTGAYHGWKAINFRPTYYACLNLEEGPSHADAIGQLVEENRIRRFLLRDNVCRLIGRSPRILNYDELREANPFLAVDPVSTGSHALLLAVVLGYRLVGLAGIDIHKPLPPLQPDASLSDGEPAGEAAPAVPASTAPAADSPPGAPTQPEAEQVEIGLHLQAWRAVGKRAASAGVRVFNIADDSPFDQFPHLPLEDFRSLAQRRPG